MVNKLIGYLISIIGLVVLAISRFPSVKSLIPFTLPFADKYIIIAGLIIVIIGVALSFTKSTRIGKEKQASEEVPIYQGEGKNRKIIGYKRA